MSAIKERMQKIWIKAMPVSTKRMAFLSLAVVIAASLVSLVAATRPAEAAFPGTNGKIVFHSDRSIVGGDPSTTDAEIFSMNSNGTDLTQLTVNAVQDFNPAWSPNGLAIAFVRREGDDEIYKMAANGSNQIPLTANAARDNEPTFSPDGKKLAFVSDRSTNEEIYTMSSSNGSNVVRLTRNGDLDFSPAWSPNGKRIAFTSLRTGNYEIYTMKPQPEGRTNRPVNLSRSTLATDISANWSPDGTHIVFTSLRGISGDYEIYTMRANGAEPTPLTENTTDDFSPAFSPDGTKIAFNANRDGNGEIYVMNADGTSPQNMTISTANDNDPDWQPGS